MNDHERLIAAYLDDELSESGREELNAWLKAGAANLRQFTEAVIFEQQIRAAAHANARQRAAADFDSPAIPPVRWLQWRPLTAAAAGLVLGMFCTSMVWAYVGPYAGNVLTLLQENFESGPVQTLPGLPRETGVWSGDGAQVVSAEKSLKPAKGTKMLRFVSATFPGENAKQSAWGDVYRLVDLRGQVSQTKSVLRLSANFDALPFPAGEGYLCSVELCALETDISNAPRPLALPWVRENSASTALRKFPMNGDGVWQEASVEVPVSPQTRFVLVHLAVMRTKPFPPVEPVQFSGHYLDNVRLELRTQPAKP